jgi:hypothetical protein
MKKLVVLSLSVLSLTVNAGFFSWIGFNKSTTETKSAPSTPKAEESQLMTRLETAEEKPQAVKRGLVQRFKESKFVPGGDKTKAVGRAIAKPFKAIKESYTNLQTDNNSPVSTNKTDKNGNEIYTRSRAKTFKNIVSAPLKAAKDAWGKPVYVAV